jgi:hypothetical protein
MSLKSTLILAVLLSNWLSVFAQKVSDTSFVASAKKYVIDLHENSLRTQSRLYNGSRYVDPPFTSEEYPFLSSDDWVTGSVFYDGELFENIPLMYDLMNQVVVAEHFPSGHSIRLIPEKLQWFTLEGRLFERIENSSVQNSLPETGFYEVLYNGNTKLIARRIKYQRERIEDRQVHYWYEPRYRYFTLLNGVYFPVKSKGSILKLMAHKKQEINRMLRQQGIVFGREKERALQAIVNFYDNNQ